MPGTTRLFDPIPAVAVLLLTLAGCAERQTVTPGDTLPLLTRSGRNASLATDGPRLRRQLRRAGLADARTPKWFDERRDHPRAVYIGYEGGTVEHAVTHTYDRQTSTSSRIHDHFQSNTRTVTSTSSYR